MRFVRILSRTLNQVFASEIGLYCLGSFGRLGSFGSRIIVASPMVSGTSLFSHICWMSLVVISTATSPPDCKASALMLSGPVALFLASLFITSLISALLGAGEGVLSVGLSCGSVSA